jgi:peptidoglycan/xylan/chitin deacetylase (PgdA/CDA1 family)
MTAWPDNAPYALCLTHDVDHVTRRLYQRLWRGARCGPAVALREFRDTAATLGRRSSAWNFERLAELEDAYQVRSTFLFLDETAKGFGPKYWGRYRFADPSVASVIRELDAGGWEIGLHGSLFSYNSPALLEQEKDRLERIVGHPVVSGRQHYLRLEEGVTFALYDRLGLTVDSTRGYSHKPYDGRYGVMPYTPEGSGVVELPITLMDTIGLENPAIRRRSEEVVADIAGQGGVVTLDWHQCVCNATLFPERLGFYKDVLCEARRQGAWISTMGKIASHWRKGDLS